MVAAHHVTKAAVETVAVLTIANDSKPDKAIAQGACELSNKDYFRWVRTGRILAHWRCPALITKGSEILVRTLLHRYPGSLRKLLSPASIKQHRESYSLSCPDKSIRFLWGISYPPIHSKSSFFSSLISLVVLPRSLNAVVNTLTGSGPKRVRLKGRFFIIR